MWLIGGGIGVSHVRGAVSPDYRVYQLDDTLEPRFIHHLLRSAPYRDQYRLLVRAETTFDRRITKDDFGGLPIPSPSLSAQRAIADHLDRETARIDALIGAKRRMLELLEERRVATIARAVTPPSDASDWQLLRLRYVVRRMIDTEHKTAPFYDDGRFLVIRTSNISRGRLVVGPGSKFTDAVGYQEWTRRGVPEAGDILLTREAPAGEACLVPAGMQGCVGQRTVLLKVNEARILARYFLWALYGGWRARS
jgi:type I restriction enzyme S subunit